MEELQEEVQEEVQPLEQTSEAAPEQEDITVKPRKRRPRTRSPIERFFASIGNDVKWYYDIRLWSPLILVVLLLAIIPGKNQAAMPLETVPESEPIVLETEPMPEQTVPPTQAPVDPRAEALARLADTVGAGRSDNVKTVIMWVAINREEDRANGYGKSLEEEIARPSQWQGYDENGSYSESTYAIAQQVLEAQAIGALRPVDSDMLWFVLNDDGSITLRNRFTATANQKWREKTVR